MGGFPDVRRASMEGLPVTISHKYGRVTKHEFRASHPLISEIPDSISTLKLCKVVTPQSKGCMCMGGEYSVKDLLLLLSMGKRFQNHGICLKVKLNLNLHYG